MSALRSSNHWRHVKESSLDYAWVALSDRVAAAFERHSRRQSALSVDHP